MEQEGLLENKTDAAKVLKISVRKLDYLIAEKQLKTVHIGARVLVLRRSIEAFIRKNTQ